MDRQKIAARLYERANQAAADAIRFRREVGGSALAQVRERDARTLRAVARDSLRG